MEFQVKFCHSSELRLCRTGMLLLTKSKDHKSNVPCQWIHRYLFQSLKLNFKWPFKPLISRISLWNTLQVGSLDFWWSFYSSSTSFFLALLYQNSLDASNLQQKQYLCNFHHVRLMENLSKLSYQYLSTIHEKLRQSRLGKSQIRRDKIGSGHSTYCFLFESILLNEYDERY